MRQAGERIRELEPRELLGVLPSDPNGSGGTPGAVGMLGSTPVGLLYHNGDGTNTGWKLLSSVGGKWTRTANTSVSSGSAYTIVWTAQAREYSPDGTMWTSGTTITIKTAGRYAISAGVKFAATASVNSRQLWLKINGVNGQHLRIPSINGTTCFLCIAVTEELAVDDEITILCKQDSGGDIDAADMLLTVDSLG